MVVSNKNQERQKKNPRKKSKKEEMLKLRSQKNKSNSNNKNQKLLPPKKMIQIFQTFLKWTLELVRLLTLLKTQIQKIFTTKKLILEMGRSEKLQVASKSIFQLIKLKMLWLSASLI